MTSTLERFKVVHLHDRKTIDVSISDNTLVLVGENGSGKTTFLRILFHFLSGRWIALASFHFESIIATIDGKEYEIAHEKITKNLKGIDRRMLSALPINLRRRVMELIGRGDFDRVAIELQRAEGRYPIPPELLPTLARQLDFFEGFPRGLDKELREMIRHIQGAINAQVLYLPTYRRIERELGSIFEGVDPDDFRRQRNRIRSLESEEAYIELVEFGMKDVQHAVDRTLGRLKDFARENLNNLTLGYLGDVVNQEYQNVKMKQIADVSDDTVRSVLDRIDDSILRQEHKRHLYSVIDSARSDDAPSEHQKIIYHYFLKLLTFQKELNENEKQMSAFCELCSEYIVDKRFVYDSSTFSFSIVPTDVPGSDRTIELRDLSSGEKQIVSLFSHLYLSGQKNFFVLIDEPELSLSVPWQRRFLPDISRGAFCQGLVAVTHSPFIYDNDLRRYTHAIGEFVST